ncbi:signal transduction histidine kinase/ABC-type amino acid transport substrate-binding protein [Clostridiales Family XIII bacterium PM5-7]
MKKNLGFLIVSTVIILWFTISMNIMIRYNLDWIDYAKYSFGLNSSQREYVNNEEIICGVNYNDLPLSFIHEDNQYDGMFIDFISQLSVELENNMMVEMNEEETLKNHLRAHKIQTAIVDKNSETEKEFLFTEPIYIMHGKMLVKEDSKFDHINQLRNVKVAVERRDVEIAARINELYGSKDITVVYVENTQEALEKLNNNQVAAVAGDETKLSYQLNQQRNDQYFKFLKYSYYRNEVCLAVNQEDEDLLNLFNKGILSMKKKNLITKTQSKWFGALQPETVDMQEVDFTYKIVLLFLLLAIGFTLWNLSTAKKVTEKTRELQTSKEELRLIVDALDRGLVIADERGSITEINKTISRMTGVNADDILGHNIKAQSATRNLLDREDGKVFKWNNRYYTKQTLAFHDDKQLYVVEDCTQRHINQVRNVQEEKMIAVGQLSAGLAHEIRNPLGLIKSYVFLVKEMCTGEDGRHAISVINDSIKRINNLIESLLRFSKLSDDEYRRVNLRELISNILFLEKKTVESKGITVSWQLHTSKGEVVLINEDLLNMILINLLNNSIDAIGEVKRQGHIDINIEVKSQMIHIIFQDNGCGVDQEKLLEIFNPFYSSKEKGTGLGLYVVSTQLEQIGGTIRAESVLGEETTFYVEMPLRREDSEQ